MPTSERFVLLLASDTQNLEPFLMPEIKTFLSITFYCFLNQKCQVIIRSRPKNSGSNQEFEAILFSISTTCGRA